MALLVLWPHFAQVICVDTAGPSIVNERSPFVVTIHANSKSCRAEGYQYVGGKKALSTDVWSLFLDCGSLDMDGGRVGYVGIRSPGHVDRAGIGSLMDGISQCFLLSNTRRLSRIPNSNLRIDH